MAERAAHLVDHVIPDVPVRQWVLSLPYRLRYRLAWDHDLCRRVTAVFVRAVFRLLRNHARAAGLEHPRGGAVAIIRRFGGALNLNVHIHALVLDGVFARHDRGVAFHPAPRLTTLDVAEVLAAVEPAIRRLLDKGELPEGNREGHAEDGGVDRWADEAPALAGLAAASVQGFVALGRHSSIRLHRLGLARDVEEPRPLGPCHARWNGLDLHAGLVIPARQRDRLERVCRYVLRPPVTPERLTLTADGRVRLALRQPWADGTTHVVFDPVEFLGRLAVLVPRPGGLYALVERGCRFIVISDCGADPGLGFEDIGVAIRRCRIDFAAEIDLSIDEFAPQASTHVVRGTITYHPDHLRMLGLPATEQHGTIVWIKPSVTNTNAADVRQYRLARPDFPQQSTADQWYDESQFESYRRLGYESARQAFADVLVECGAFDAIEGLFGSGPSAVPMGVNPAQVETA